MANEKFQFPSDASGRHGAVEAAAPGSDRFVLPVRVYGEDGVTAVSEENPQPVADGKAVLQLTTANAKLELMRQILAELNEVAGTPGDEIVGADLTAKISQVSLLKGLLAQLRAITAVSLSGSSLGDHQALPVRPTAAYDSTRDALREVRPTLLDKVLNFFSLAAGAELGGFVNTEGYTTIVVMGQGTQTFDLTSTPSPDGSYLLDKETLAAGAAANSGVGKKPAIPGPWIYVTVKNTSANPGNFNLWVYGV